MDRFCNTDPGIVSTDMITMKKWFDPLADIFFRPFIRTPRQGAEAAIRLLLDKTYVEISGQIYTSGGVKNISSKYRNNQQQSRLWSETENLLKIISCPNRKQRSLSEA